MEVKKSERANLEKKRLLFVEVGLILSLAIVYGAFSFSTKEKAASVLDAGPQETIEEEIALLEEKIGTLENQMNESSSDFLRLNELSAKKEETEAVLEEKMQRWMYLEELAQKISEQG